MPRASISACCAACQSSVEALWLPGSRRSLPATERRGEGMILVTGSAGHLGEALMRVLRGRGWPARGIDVKRRYRHGDNYNRCGEKPTQMLPPDGRLIRAKTTALFCGDGTFRP